MINYYEPNIDLTLLGCGFLGAYHVGAIYLLSQIWPQKPYNRICGSSCGGLLSAFILAGIRIEVVLDNATNILRLLCVALRRPWQFIPIKSLVKLNLETILPANAHKLCTQRLGLSLTEVWSFKNLFVTQFDSRQDLIDAITAGCFIPVWSGSLTIPKFKGERYIDGAYSNNAPKFDMTHEERLSGLRQVDISPFASEIDVSPPDKSGLCKVSVFQSKYYLSWKNLIRSRDAMIPYKFSQYKLYLLDGHRDMKDYVLRNNLVKCLNCYRNSICNSSVISKIPDTNLSSGGSITTRVSCLECLKLIEMVDSLKLPQEIIKIME